MASTSAPSAGEGLRIRAPTYAELLATVDAQNAAFAEMQAQLEQLRSAATKRKAETDAPRVREGPALPPNPFVVNLDAERPLNEFRDAFHTIINTPVTLSRGDEQETRPLKNWVPFQMDPDHPLAALKFLQPRAEAEPGTRWEVLASYEQSDKSNSLACRAIVASMARVPYIIAVCDIRSTASDVCKKIGTCLEAVRTGLKAIGRPDLVPYIPTVKFLDGTQALWQTFDFVDATHMRVTCVMPTSYNAATRRLLACLEDERLRGHPVAVDFDEGDKMFKKWVDLEERPVDDREDDSLDAAAYDGLDPVPALINVLAQFVRLSFCSNFAHREACDACCLQAYIRIALQAQGHTCWHVLPCLLVSHMVSA